jgi:uncharacterized protein (UPF0276 family)
VTSPRENPAVSQPGVGLVWWPELDPLCRPSEGLVHVIEAEPETFWIPRDMKSSGFMSRLPTALEHLPQPKLLHGVGAPFGGCAMQTISHRETLAGDIAALQPAWISDHLSFNQFVFSRADGADEVVNTGFFLPPAQCERGVEIAAEQIRLRRVTTGMPVAFEVPVSYLPRRPGEMPDGAFAAAVAEAADCGILLDLHNLLCNERNGRQSVAEFCQSIPLERVWEIHLAGGEAASGFWVDSHSGLVEPALMEIVASSFRNCRLCARSCSKSFLITLPWSAWRRSVRCLANSTTFGVATHRATARHAIVRLRSWRPRRRTRSRPPCGKWLSVRR